MSSATTPPRCPHRVAISRPNHWLSVLLASLLGSTTATVSLYGQETSLLDYRFVAPASHMQPWPDDEPEIFITPNATPRIAAKWRTNLSPKHDGNTSTDESKLPDPELESKANDVEVLIVPQKARTEKSASAKRDQEPASQPRDCYQAPPLSALSVSIALPTGKLPTNAAAQCAAQTALTGDARLAGAWAGTDHHWSATCSRHRPLYFEEINAERYGYTASYALQPLISGAHFFATIPALPYKMAVDRPRDCIYTLGHYRPGSCAPRRWNRLPLQLSATAVEVGFIAGLILLVP